MAIPAETGLSRLPSGPDGVTQWSSLYKETPGPGPLPVGVPSKLLLYYKAPTAWRWKQGKRFQSSIFAHTTLSLGVRCFWSLRFVRPRANCLDFSVRRRWEIIQIKPASTYWDFQVSGRSRATTQPCRETKNFNLSAKQVELGFHSESS